MTPKLYEGTKRLHARPIAERWQKASGASLDRALSQIGEAEEAYFEVRLA